MYIKLSTHKGKVQSKSVDPQIDLPPTTLNSASFLIEKATASMICDLTSSQPWTAMLGGVVIPSWKISSWRENV